MTMNETWVRVALAACCGAALLSGVACDADGSPHNGVAQGSLSAAWTSGPVATCAQLGLVAVRVHASMEGMAPVSRTEACASDARAGSIFIDALTPGTWSLELEGLDAAGAVTHEGALSPVVTVSADSHTESDEVLLKLKPADVIVDWSVGGKCGGAGIVTVLAELYDAQGWPLREVGPMEVDCDASFVDPRDGRVRTGVLFARVPAEPGVTALVRGLDSQSAAIWRGDEGPLDLSPGQLTELLVELAPCAGDPPDCD